VYATIEAVEQFVDHHYEAQVRSLQDQPALQPLGQTLLALGDEVAHRDEAPLRGPQRLALVCACGAG
jgi:ubiquinone biosynthesis monooxygenase Coq7